MDGVSWHFTSNFRKLTNYFYQFWYCNLNSIILTLFHKHYGILYLLSCHFILCFLWAEHVSCCNVAATHRPIKHAGPWRWMAVYSRSGRLHLTCSPLAFGTTLLSSMSHLLPSSILSTSSFACWKNKRKSRVDYFFIISNIKLNLPQANQSIDPRKTHTGNHLHFNAFISHQGQKFQHLCIRKVAELSCDSGTTNPASHFVI